MTSSRQLLDELQTELLQITADHELWDGKRVKIAAVRTTTGLSKIKKLAVATRLALLDERKAYVAEQAGDKRRLAR